MSRLYLVDDHAIVREGLRAVLEAAGHRVIGESADPVRAIADLVRDPADLVLVDLSLGERSGLELLAELQRRALPVRSIVLTMSAQPHHVGEALRRGALSYVLKGSPTSELLRAIDAAMHGRRHLAPEVANLAVEALTVEDDDGGFAMLSPRERQIVAMVVRGQSSAAIGQSLHLSPKTVDTYRSRLMNKLRVGDVPALVRLAIRHGVIEA